MVYVEEGGLSKFSPSKPVLVMSGNGPRYGITIPSVITNCDVELLRGQIEHHCGIVEHPDVVLELSKLNRRAMRAYHAERLKGNSEVGSLVSALRSYNTRGYRR